MKHVHAGAKPVHIWKFKYPEGFKQSVFNVDVLKEDFFDNFILRIC